MSAPVPEDINNEEDVSVKLNEDDFDDIPSLFLATIAKDVRIFSLKKKYRLKLLMKQIGKELRTNLSVIVRGIDGQTEKCIACTEMVKNWLAEKPVIGENDCTKIYQWTKIGEIKLKSENKLELDTYIPVLEILLSRQPFNEVNDSMQESNAVEAKPLMYSRQDTNTEFAPLKRRQPDPIGRENPHNIWRRKRKI